MTNCLCLPVCTYLSMPTVCAYRLCLPSVPTVCAYRPCLPVYAYLSVIWGKGRPIKEALLIQLIDELVWEFESLL